MKLVKHLLVKCLFCCLLITGFSTLVQAASAPAIEITPSRFEVLVEPRGQNVQSIKISNMGKEDVHMTAVAQDWDMAEDGKLVLKEAGSIAESASSWIRFNPKKFTIAPGQTQFIRFSVTVPPNVKPGEYRASLVLMSEDKYEMQEGFYFKPTFAILVYVNVPKISRQGEMTDVKVTVDEQGLYSLEGKIQSVGNAHLRLTGEYFLYNSAGLEVKNEQVGKAVILPGRFDQFKAALGADLEPGTYKLRLIWHYLPAFYMEGKLDEYPLNDEGLVKEFSFTI